MSRINYNKLVRDRIPEIIEAAGKRAKWEIIKGVEYQRMVDAKLNEELVEYQNSHDIEELADLLEVIYAAARVQGISPEALEMMRKKKANERGGFEKGIRLLEVE